MAATMGQLDWYQATQSDDVLKGDLELLCTHTGHVEEEHHLCDIEDGDTFATLVSIIEEHELRYHQ